VPAPKLILVSDSPASSTKLVARTPTGLRAGLSHHELRDWSGCWSKEPRCVRFPQ